MPDPQKPLQTLPYAKLGQAVNYSDVVPERNGLPRNDSLISEYADYQPNLDIDYTDIKEVNLQLTNLIVRLHAVRRELANAEKILAEAEWDYQQKYRREIITLSGGSSEGREALAELACEQELSRVIVSRQAVKTLTQHSRILNQEQELLSSISNNVRKLIDLQ